MWFKKKKVEEPKTETVVIQKVEEKPKETTRIAMMEITVINNKTDKEYIIKSDNDFGLTWEIVKDCISINQYKSINKNDGWMAKGRFIDFSVSATVWKTFDII
jgi:hypothetical protein